MTQPKPWYASKTVWGSLVAILAAFLGLWDFDISPADQTRLVDLAVQLIGAGGGLVALIGRFMATRPIL